jgi:hypothetical protein
MKKQRGWNLPKSVSEDVAEIHQWRTEVSKPQNQSSVLIPTPVTYYHPSYSRHPRSHHKHQPCRPPTAAYSSLPPHTPTALLTMKAIGWKCFFSHTQSSSHHVPRMHLLSPASFSLALCSLAYPGLHTWQKLRAPLWPQLGPEWAKTPCLSVINKAPKPATIHHKAV